LLWLNRYGYSIVIDPGHNRFGWKKGVSAIIETELFPGETPADKVVF